MGAVHASCLGTKSRYVEKSTEEQPRSRGRHQSDRPRMSMKTLKRLFTKEEAEQEGGLPPNEAGDQQKTPLDSSCEGGASSQNSLSNPEESPVLLIDAIEKSTFKVRTVKGMISRGSDVNERSDVIGNTPLVFSVQKGHKELVKCLLKSGSDPDICNVYNGTALYYAIISGQCSIAAILVDAGADVNNTGTHEKREKTGDLCAFPLAAAIHRKCETCFNLLMEHGVEVNCVDKDGRTPLVHALAENPWSKMSYPTPGDPSSFENRACGELPRSFASLETGASILHCDRIGFAHALLARGADLLAVWEKILWCMWCQSPFDGKALELCIRALPLASLRAYQPSTPGASASAVFSSLLYHEMGRHMYLLYLSGFTPSVPKEKLLFDPVYTTWLVKAGTTPRTLQNACVVSIRTAMAGEGNVIHKTGQLDLPDKLKRMITLDISKQD